MTRTWTHNLKTVSAFVTGLAALSAVEATALEFNSGDLVLAIYANSQEYYRNLGPASTVLAGPRVDIDLSGSPLNPLTVTAGSEPARWSLLSGQGTTQLNTFINTASAFTSAEIATGQYNSGVVAVNSGMSGWRNALGLATGPGTEAVLPATDPASYTSSFGVGGTLSGTFTSAQQQGLFNQVLTMIKGQARVGAEANVLSDVGRALLTSNGLLSICGTPGCELQPVPAPAALILFGTGLIGLAAISRRMRGQIPV